MFRNFCGPRTAVHTIFNPLRAFAAVVLASALYASAVEYRVQSCTPSQITLSFSLSKAEESVSCASEGFSFGFTAPPTGNASLAAVSSFPAVGTLPCAVTPASAQEKSSFQWVMLSTCLAGTPTRQGTISIVFDRPVVQTGVPAPCSVNGKMIHIRYVSSAAKRMTASKPVIPFRRGVRIEVNTDGIYRIDANQLLALGVPIQSIPSRELRLFEKSREIPLFITNPHRPSLATDDAILFYGEHLRGDNSFYTQYSRTNVYWLTWGTGGVGARMAEVSGARRVDETLYRPGENDIRIAASAFPDTLHLEEDNDIRWLGDIAAPQEIETQNIASDTTDNWYWGFIGTDEKTDYSIEIPSPSSSTNDRARLRIGMMGLSSIADVPDDHQISILLNGNTPSITGTPQVAIWDGSTPFTFTTDYFPSTMLTPENGTVSILTFLRQAKRIDRSALNWIEIEYLRTFKALHDRILFKNNARDINGVYQFSISGFTGRDIDLWDLSNRRVYTGFTITQNDGTVKGGFTLTFQDTLTSACRFLAQTITARKSPAAMTYDTISDAWEFSDGIDYVIVTARSMRSAYDPLMQYYREKGFTVATVGIEDVYNRFSYGIRDPQSIRSMVAYLFAQNAGRTLKYLLLGGDTSHDLDKQRNELNIVPTHLSRIPGWGPAADDGYFATVSGDDQYPDLFVGRFPARNYSDARIMVDKTLKYLRSSRTGFWRDNLLMIGGVEQDFSAFNDDAMQTVIGPQMNAMRMDAFQGSPWFNDQSTAAKTISDKINAGVYAVNFNGHGGGNVWSDNGFYSYTDLDKLYNAQWGGARLPVVFSFTCLTGFFESAFYRSLGEEFLRNKPDGCIAFLGASAYTSKVGNLRMNRILLDHAVHSRVQSLGELIWLTRIEMLGRYGGQYLPLVQQYNLLGDPALPWELVPDTMRITTRSPALSPGDSLAVQGNCTPVATGSVKIALGSGTAQWSERIIPVQAGSFDAAYPVKDSLRTGHGWVRAFAWNDSVQVRGFTEFSKDSILIKTVTLAPARPYAGDTVRVRCVVQVPQGFGIDNVVCLSTYAPPSASRPQLSQTGMIRDTGDSWIAVSPITLTPGGLADEAFMVQFRVTGNGFSTESQRYIFNVLGLPDLRIVPDTLTAGWSGDSLQVRLRVLNAGNADAAGFSAAILWEGTGDTIARVVSTGVLRNGSSIPVALCLPDTQGDIRFTAICALISPTAETNVFNNTAFGRFTVSSADLSDSTDTIFSPGRGVWIRPARALPQKCRVFLFLDTIAAQQPLASESSWLTLQGDGIARFTLGARPALTSADTMHWSFLPQNPQSTVTGRSAVALMDTTLGLWRCADGTITPSDASITLADARSGPFALMRFSDVLPPGIRASVHGRELVFVDYAAQGKPFSLYLTDESGVVPSSVSIVLNGNRLDSNLISSVQPVAPFNNVTLTAYPPSQHSVDSLIVTARDFAGNTARRVFAYRPGEDLEVKFVSCYPNPFSAKQNSQGQTIQKIRLAYLLTDAAADVTLSLYTISGRPVISWHYSDKIGYQEVEWDGKTQNGYRIANGTYYLKLTASNDRRKVVKITRIAKLEGF